jgi:hypothetical protein
MWMPSHWLRIQFSISDKDANTFKTLLVVHLKLLCRKTLIWQPFLIEQCMQYQHLLAHASSVIHSELI